MKEMNSLEMQLHSWELRRPSAELKRRIFRPRTRRASVAVAFRWMAPAAACAFLVLTYVHQDAVIPAGAAGNDALVAMNRSNQTAGVGFFNGQSQATGNFATIGFEWTNRSDSTSSINSFLPAR